MLHLLPAVYFATQNNTRVVISTNTINLQEQLLNKDIPLLKTALEIPFRSAVLKGRSNYLCPRRLTAMRRRGPTTPEETQLLAKVIVWQTTNQSGERSEITLRGRVLSVGGLKEKAMAAHRAGIKTLLLPKRNQKDMIEIPPKVRRDITFIFVESMDKVLDHALLPKGTDN